MIKIEPPIVWTKPLQSNPDTPHLIGTIEIAGTPHHIEAFKVEWDGDIQNCEKPELCSFDELSEIVLGAMETVEIDGAEYVILVTPFQM